MGQRWKRWCREGVALEVPGYNGPRLDQSSTSYCFGVGGSGPRGYGSAGTTQLWTAMREEVQGLIFVTDQAA